MRPFCSCRLWTYLNITETRSKQSGSLRDYHYRALYNNLFMTRMRRCEWRNIVSRSNDRVRLWPGILMSASSPVLSWSPSTTWVGEVTVLMSLSLASESEPFIMHVLLSLSLMNPFCQESWKAGENTQDKFGLMGTKKLVLGRKGLSCVSPEILSSRKTKQTVHYNAKVETPA